MRHAGWRYLFQAAYDETNTSSRISWNLSLGIRDAWEDLTREVDDLLDQFGENPKVLALAADDSIGSQSILHELVVRLLEKRFGRTFWVR